MKGLLLKDWYMLRKAALLYAVIAVGFVPWSGGILTVLYASMLPITAFAYDDRSRWGELAAMLPYSVRDIVLSRYLMGGGGCVLFCLIALAGQTVFAAVLPKYSDGMMWFGFQGFVIILSFSMIFLSVSLPLSFRFDAEKSRMIRFLILAITAGTMGSVMVIGSIGQRYAGSGFDMVFLLPVVCTAVLATVVSIPLSMWAYRARRK